MHEQSVLQLLNLSAASYAMHCNITHVYIPNVFPVYECMP